jgi:hypothetical protein
MVVGAKTAVREKNQPDVNSANNSNSNKTSTENTKDSKLKQSPYTQILNNAHATQLASGNTTGLSLASSVQNKR